MKRTYPSPGNPADFIKHKQPRKGTRSCWECKRRKMRCAFARQSDAVCIACERRGTSCISQESAENEFPLVVAGGDQTISTKLDRVGELLAQCVRMVARGGAEVEEDLDGGQRHSKSQRLDTVCDQAGSVQSATSPDFLGSRLRPTLSSKVEVERALVANWPERQDFDSIVKLKVQPFQVVRAVNCAKDLHYCHQDRTISTSPWGALQLPPEGTHPVFVARKLLMLALFLQCARPPPPARLYGIMARAVDAAHYLVTSRDDLVDSVEGIECLLMEATFENSAGNLQRAWLAARRAVTMSQMIGLDGDTVLPTAATTEYPCHNASANRNHMWFRVVQTDHYLSLMSGLPPGSNTDGVIDANVLQPCAPLQRLHRFHCAAVGRLLQQRRGTMSAAGTRDIDKMLQDASTSVPTQWWLVPHLDNSSTAETALEEISRMMDQVTHYHLIVQLHMPRAMAGGEEDRLHSTLSAFNASREVMLRYTAARKASDANGEACYCPSLDALAFVSSVCLCWAHISYPEQGLFGFEHQRYGNRAMVEWFVDRLRRSHDSAQMLAALERLLEIELIVATSRDKYVFVVKRPDTGADRVTSCGGRVSDAGDDDNEGALHIHIPCLGLVAVQRSRTTDTCSPALEPYARLEDLVAGEELSMDMMAFLQDP